MPGSPPEPCDRSGIRSRRLNRWPPLWEPGHEQKHSAKEYVRGDVHTNSVENYFLLFKRGMRGTYQHCAEKHLHRYLAEFEFRFNHREALGWNDEARTLEAVRGAEGKRLTYHQPNQSGL